ncbi:MAG: BamA/TamA family outer membrane protein [Bacteroidia bacterium]|nr:BamA/TamA family outer membrane protein [Bacteroidia bacterium]
MALFMRQRLAELWILLSFLAACSPARFLAPNERLVAREPSFRGNLLEELPPLYTRSNARALGIRTGLQLYWAGKVLTESRHVFWRTLRRIPKLRYYIYALGYNLQEKIGEPPALLLDRNITRDVALLREAYVQQGYFQVAIQPQIRPFTEKEVEVIYRIRPGPQWHIQEIDVEGPDPAMVGIAADFFADHMIIGEPYNLSRLDKLREELHEILLESGYYGLPLAQLIWEIDTTSMSAQPASEKNILRRWIGLPQAEYPSCRVRLLLPERYQRYVAGRIQLTLRTSDSEPTQKAYYHGIEVRSDERAEAVIDPRILLRKVYYGKTPYYDHQVVQASQRSLQALEVVQWVGPSSNPEGDSVHINYEVFLRPPIDMGLSIEGFQSSQPLVGNVSLPGASASVRGTYLSPFRRAAPLRLRGQVALSYFRPSLSAPPLPLYNVIGELSLTFPEGIFRLGEAAPLPLPQTLSRRFHSLLLSYQDIRQIEFLRRYLTLSWSRQVQYQFKDQRQEDQIWTPLSLTFVSTRFSPAFAQQIDNLSPLVRSLILRDYLPRLTQLIAWQVSSHKNYFSPIAKKGDYSSFLVELGGVLPFFVEHLLVMTFPQWDSTYRDNRFLNRFPYGVFLRALVEGRLRYRLLSSQQLYLRGRIGAGQGLYYTLDLPFENRFFVGGPNSMRAWQFGGLGPGKYAFGDNLFLIPGGSLLAEFNIELRQNLYRGLQMAPFVDIGNVWFISSTYFEDARGIFWHAPWPGIGGGIGLRWDFSVLAVRVDVAQQIYNPASGWVLRQFPLGATGVQYVFAVGYPF